MKTCPKCGEKIIIESPKFCPNCGIEFKINPSNLKNQEADKLKNDNINKLVDGASSTLNQVVTQAKIEKNYIKNRIEDNNKTQVKGDTFILSEKIANTIDNLNNEKTKTEIKVDNTNQKREKTKIKIEDNKIKE